MNEIQIADIVPTIQNPHNINGRRGVGYGFEEAYAKFQKNNAGENAEFVYPEADYLEGGRYLRMGFSSEQRENPKYPPKIALDEYGEIDVVGVDHDVLMGGKIYTIVNLKNGKRILVDGAWSKDRFSPWQFTQLNGKKDYLDIWSNDIYLARDAQDPNLYHRHGWNAKFHDGTFGMVDETGWKEILVPLHSGPKDIDRILGVTKILTSSSRRVGEIEALVGGENGVPRLIARVRIDSLKFIQAITEVKS